MYIKTPNFKIKLLQKLYVLLQYTTASNIINITSPAPSKYTTRSNITLYLLLYTTLSNITL